MAVTKSKSIITSIISLLSSSAMAQELLPGKWKTKFLFNFYDQDSNSGHQVFDGTKDEGLTVVEPMLFISNQIDANTNVSGHIVLDAWSAQSDTKLDGNTGQSGKGIGNQSRISANFSMLKEVNKNIWSPRLGFSSEYDYKSFNGGLGWERSFAKDNFTLSLSLDYFKDQTKLFNYQTEKTTDFEDKTVVAYNLGASQILTRNDIISWNFSYVDQSGALESIRNTTKFGNTRVAENLPDSRKRYALTTQLIHAFNDENAISTKYRYYTDSWEMNAHTIETEYRKSIQDDDGLITFNYRYHEQNEIEYFTKELFTTAPTFLSSDSDQDGFTAHRLGMGYTLDAGAKKIKKLDISKLEYSLGLYHYFRSNDLKYNVIQSSVGIEF